MDDENEANEAVKELDGSKVAGERIRVEAPSFRQAGTIAGLV